MQVTMKTAVGSMVAALAATASLADTAWKADVYSGSWTNAANWTAGVPSDVIAASIENSGADYTVTIDSDSMLYATNTTVGNASGTTTVYVDSPITFFPGTAVMNENNAFFHQTRGAKTIVRTNGGMIFDGAATCSGKLWIENSDFIVDGGQVDFNGGKQIVIAGAAATPATLVVTNGGAFSYHCESMISEWFLVGENTRINVHGGTFSVSHNRNIYYKSPFRLNGGQISVSGAGVFEVQNRAQAAQLALNSGSLSLADDATLKCTALLMQPQNDAHTMTVSFSGNSTISPGLYGAAETFIGDSHGRSVFDWNSSSAASDVLRTVFVGFNRGIGELNIRNGYLSIGKSSGVFVGSAEARNERDAVGGRYWGGGGQVNDASLFAPTGIVRVTGGAMFEDTQYATSAYNPTRLCGLVVGDGSLSYNAEGYAGRPCYGRFELSGGGVTNRQAYFVVGYGRAVGRFVQTGGNFFKGDPGYPGGTVTQPIAIGLAGGDGAYAISNGIHTAYVPVFVGGATFADLGAKASIMTSGNYPKNARNAKGALSLACADMSKPCTFRVNSMNGGSIQGVWVGRDGDGTVEIIGSGSTLDVQYTGLTLTNGFTVANGETETPGELLTHGQATLRFVFDADGVGLIDSRYAAVKIAPNAKLEVDMSAYSGSPKKVMLVRCQSRDNSFAPENMTLKNCTIVQDEDANIYAMYKRGGGFIIAFE